ncbi:competence protein ComEC [Actinoplanes tereljensis]|uniref:Competence protein ComEC n=1 Tax=Paractinoplanes tereljensis TaxID=571912 RepID=A0A919U017_9ACTN|nr:ComEC/Rec2 family competence protein [Actinoplanes tereljensis]GIF26452.1 competence protein ComEC [Actinoplanes tereljensis]
MTGGVPDLRLAGFAVATWLSSLTALYLSARSGILLGAAALACAAVTVAVASRRGPVSILRRLAPAPGSRRTVAGAAPGPRRTAGGAAGVGSRRPAASATQSRGTAMPESRRTAAGAVRWIGLTILLGVGCGAVATGARVMARESGPLVALVRAGEPVRIEAVVRDDPRALRGSPAMPPTYLVAIDLRAVGAEDAAPLRLEARALVLGSDPGWRGLLPGQRFTARGKLMPPRGGDLRAAVVSAKGAPELIGRPSWAQRAAGVLRAGLQRACEPLPDDSGGLLPGLVVGDTSRLDEALSDDFRTTGMTHLMAVSGANVAIILGVVLFTARRTRAGPRTQAVVCAVVLVGFVILARPSPSVVRAAAMGTIGLVGLASGRPKAALPALAAGVAALILYDPELAADPGFALSVLATSGLLLLAPAWRDALRRRGWPAGAAEALAVPAAAQVACGPVVAGLSGTVSLIAVPANLVVVPAIAPATLLGVGAAVLSPVWAGGAEFAAWLGHWPAKWLVIVATYGARVPAGALPWPDGTWGALLLAAITVAVLFAARRPVLRRLAVVMTMAGMLGAMPVRLLASGWPPANWIVVTCAVGQGDAVVLPAGPSRAVVIDAGPEADPVDHCLRRLGVRQVALFVASHFHVDHIGGVAGVFRGRQVGAVAGPDWPQPPAGRASVAAAARPVQLHAIGPGWSYQVGALRLTVIGPFEPLHGTNSDPNNNSLVLRAEVGGEIVLLPGDAETEEQDELLRHLGPEALRADVLKVSHHGSAYQSPAFVDAVDPAVALVSVGKDNDYGHPNASLLARLARGGARVLRTDESGDLAAVAARNGLAVVARGDPPDS